MQKFATIIDMTKRSKQVGMPITGGYMTDKSDAYPRLDRYGWECEDCGAAGTAPTIPEAEEQIRAHSCLQRHIDELFAAGLIRPNGVRDGKTVWVAVD